MEDITIRCACGNPFTWTVKDQEFYKQKGFERPKKCKKCRDAKKQKTQNKRSFDDNKEWGECIVCGMETFLVADLGMCGPCTFGEADTINGNW